MLQVDALEILKMGHNVFLTGAAGAGKTHTLRAYIKYLREHNIEVAITASTGIAATHIGGMTIHAWSGLGVRDHLTAHDIEGLEEKTYLWKRYENTKVLIIDEISMLHHFRFDLFDKLAKAFKRNDLPFGGMQIIICGDFFQLPPVSRAGEPQAHFAYRSKIWNEMNLKVCYLSEQHRQDDDAFLSVLNDIRNDDVNEGTLGYLQERFQAEIDSDVVPTKLYTHNADVDGINDKELTMLDGHEETYLMNTRGKANLVQLLVKSCLAPEDLRLKIGARVMFVKNNLEKGYVNGTLGIVEEFAGDHYPIISTANGKRIKAEPETWVVEEEGKIKAEISQVPLRLAWAITIHKSQGMSLDAAEIDLSKTFVAGMGYVALSRVKTLSGLRLVGFHARSLMMHPEIMEVDRDLRKKSKQAQDELIELQNRLGEQSIEEIQDEFIKRNAGLKKGAGNGGVMDADGRPLKLAAHHQTKALLKEKMSLGDIAKERNIKQDTVLDHIEKLIEEDVLESEGIDISYLKQQAFKDPRGRLRFSKIKDAFVEYAEKHPKDPEYRLSPVKQALGNSFSYAEIRLARLFLLAAV